MKMKIMNVCSMALLAIGICACSGQKKGTPNVEVATDSVEVRLGKTAFFLFILFYFFVNDHFGAYTVSQVSWCSGQLS